MNDGLKIQVRLRPDLYESLLTYVAHLDLVGDLLQDTCHAYVPKIHY